MIKAPPKKPVKKDELAAIANFDVRGSSKMKARAPGNPMDPIAEAQRQQILEISANEARQKVKREQPDQKVKKEGPNQKVEQGGSSSRHVDWLLQKNPVTAKKEEPENPSSSSWGPVKQKKKKKRRVTVQKVLPTSQRASHLASLDPVKEEKSEEDHGASGKLYL